MTDPISAPVSRDDPLYVHLPPPSAGNVSAETTAREERRRQRERNELLAVLATDDGRRVLMQILEFTRPYHTTANDPVMEGRRQVALWLIDRIGRADPERYPAMQLEHLHRRQRLAAEEAALAEDERRKTAPLGRFERLAQRIGLRKNHAQDA